MADPSWNSSPQFLNLLSLLLHCSLQSQEGKLNKNSTLKTGPLKMWTFWAQFSALSVPDMAGGILSEPQQCTLAQQEGGRSKDFFSHIVKHWFKFQANSRLGSALRRHLFWFWKWFKRFKIFHFIMCKKPRWQFLLNPWPVSSWKAYSFSLQSRQANSYIRLILAEKKFIL